MCVHLEQDVCAHGLAVGDNGLLVLSFSIPAIQLYTPGSSEVWGCKVSYWYCYSDHVSYGSRTPEELIPGSRQQHLTIHLHWWLPSKLTTGQVSVVGGADEVVGQWLVHLLVELQPIQEHRSILIRHQVSAKTITGHLTCMEQKEFELLLSLLELFDPFWVGGGGVLGPMDGPSVARVPCSGALWHWSGGVVGPCPTTRPPSIFCLCWVLNRQSSACQPSHQHTELHPPPVLYLNKWLNMGIKVKKKKQKKTTPYLIRLWILMQACKILRRSSFNVRPVGGSTA